MKEQTDRAVFQENRGWSWPVKSRKKVGAGRPVDSTLADRDMFSPGASQKTSVVVTEDDVATIPVVDDVALTADIGFVRVTGDIGSHRSTGGGDGHQEEKCREDVEAGLGPGRRDHPAVADTVCVATLDKVDDGVSVKIEKTGEKLKTEGVSPAW